MIRIVLGVAALALTGLVVNEVSGWLGLVPRGILRLVAMRLPADVRQAVYEEEWLPELIRHLREADGRPSTRLIFVRLRSVTFWHATVRPSVRISSGVSVTSRGTMVVTTQSPMLLLRTGQSVRDRMSINSARHPRIIGDIYA